MKILLLLLQAATPSPTPETFPKAFADTQLWLPIVGAACFGAVVGWMTQYVFRNTKKVDVTWLGALIGVLGGGAVTAIFAKEAAFGAYCVGLAVSFFIRTFIAPFIKFGEAAIVEDKVKKAAEEKAEADRIAQAAQDNPPGTS